MFGLILGPERVALVVMTVLAAIGLVTVIYRARDKFAHLRRDFLALSTVLTQHGLKHLGKIAECLAVDDLPGAFAEARYLRKQLEDPKLAAVLLDDVFTQQLSAKLGSAGDRTAVLKLLSDWAIANPEAVKAAGLAITILTK
jgi:hypothetical protein